MLAKNAVVWYTAKYVTDGYPPICFVSVGFWSFGPSLGLSLRGSIFGRVGPQLFGITPLYLAVAYIHCRHTT
jgi:hypothetical protein